MKLSEYEKLNPGFRKTLADALGCCVSTICRYVLLDREPGILAIAKIHELTNGAVGIEDWVTQLREKQKVEGK